MSDALSCALFGAWVRQARSELGMTRIQLAEAAGIGENTLRNVEAGTRTIELLTAARLVLAIARRNKRLTASAPVVGDGQP